MNPKRTSTIRPACGIPTGKRELSAERAPTPSVRLRRAVIAARSGLQRYPREIVASVREHKDCVRGRGRVGGWGDEENRGDRPSPFLLEEREDDVTAFWIGHATVLLRIGRINVLTDPVFSSRIGMSVGGVTFGLGRLRPPAADLHHLPRIDLVLLSHAHFDHLDRPSLRSLALGPARGATVITAGHTRRLVPPGFGEVIELPWEASTLVRDVAVRAFRPAHWGARTAIDRHRRFNAYLLESPAGRVFFAGDSAATDAFDRVGPTDLSIFGIGGYDPWEGAHATPEQVWRMYTGMAHGRPHGRLLAVHHSTFPLGREPVAEPMSRLLSAAAFNTGRVVGSVPGDGWRLSTPA